MLSVGLFHTDLGSEPGRPAEVAWLLGENVDLQAALAGIMRSLSTEHVLWVAVGRNRGARTKAVASQARTGGTFAKGVEERITIGLGADDVFCDLGRWDSVGGGQPIEPLLPGARGSKAIGVFAPGDARRAPTLAVDAMSVIAVELWSAVSRSGVMVDGARKAFESLLMRASQGNHLVVSPIAPEALGEGLAVTGAPGLTSRVLSGIHAARIPGAELRRSAQLGGYWPR
jgi:hypothetical protein